VAAIQSEVEMLKRRKEPLEEKGLDELESRDQLMSERGKLETELADLEREAAEVRSKISEAEGSIDTDLATEESKRTALLGAIPPETLEDYESIRVSKKGIGVGALVDGTCTACRESLSAVEIDRIKAKARGGEWLFRCEHCRRLLVVR
jgi:predicted  nucleic acid-binding Zn-ribbon protein